MIAAGLCAAAEDVFECKRDDLLGKPVETLLPEALRSMHPSLREAYVQAPAARRMGAGRELFAQRGNGEQFPVEIGLNPILGSGQVAVIASVIDISERRKQAERMQFIMRELSHRSKNLLAVIQGMVRQAIAGSPDMASFEQSFGRRLQGLAQSHDLLVGRNWEGVSIGELVQAQLAFLKRGDSKGISVAGPDILLSPEAAQNLGLALHELATNAVKHGALRAETGTIEISWSIDEGHGTEPRIEFYWKEAGGPAIEEPLRSGFGRTVLERVVPRSLAGSASLSFPEGGAQWRLDAPFTMLTKKGTQAAAA